MGGGRKKSGRARGDNDDDDESVGLDGGLVAGEASSNSSTAGNAESKLSEAVENLTNKRSSIRLEALKTIASIVSTSAQDAFISTHQDALMHYLTQCLKKGSEEEVVLTCKTLSIVGFTNGNLALETFTAHAPTLKVIIESPEKPVGAREAALSMLALLGYATLEPKDILEYLPCIQDIVDGGVESLDNEGDEGDEDDNTSSLISQALDAFGVLACSMEGGYLKACRLQHLTSCVELLQHPSLDVRSSAGENIALLANVTDGGVTGGGAGDDEAGFANSEWELSSEQIEALQIQLLMELSELVGISMEQVCVDMQELSTESSKRKAKKERAAQKSNFREFLRALETGEVPTHAMKVGKVRLVFTGWKMLKPLNAIKALFGSGILNHLMFNEFMAETLQVEEMLAGVMQRGDGEGDDDNRRAKRAEQKQFNSRAKESYQMKQKGRDNKLALRTGDAEDD